MTNNSCHLVRVLYDKRIGHFRVPPGLCIKTRLGAQHLIWKWFFILMQINLISTRNVEHLTLFWYRGPGELRNGLFGHYKFAPPMYFRESGFHHDQSEALPKFGWWRVISMEFLRSFLRRHFAGEPVETSQIVGFLLSLLVECCVNSPSFLFDSWGRRLPRVLRVCFSWTGCATYMKRYFFYIHHLDSL